MSRIDEEMEQQFYDFVTKSEDMESLKAMNHRQLSNSKLTDNQPKTKRTNKDQSISVFFYFICSRKEKAEALERR